MSLHPGDDWKGEDLIAIDGETRARARALIRRLRQRGRASGKPRVERPVLICRFPGCERVLKPKPGTAPKTGLCRDHNHDANHCSCQGCTERRTART